MHALRSIHWPCCRRRARHNERHGTSWLRCTRARRAATPCCTVSSDDSPRLARYAPLSSSSCCICNHLLEDRSTPTVARLLLYFSSRFIRWPYLSQKRADAYNHVIAPRGTTSGVNEPYQCTTLAMDDVVVSVGPLLRQVWLTHFARHRNTTQRIRLRQRIQSD